MKQATKPQQKSDVKAKKAENNQQVDKTSHPSKPKKGQERVKAGSKTGKVEAKPGQENAVKPKQKNDGKTGKTDNNNSDK